MLERRLWEDEPDADTEAAGNFKIQVRDRTDPAHILWEGYAVIFAETATGALLIKRRVVFDGNPAHNGVYDVAIIAPGQWAPVEMPGYIVDPEQIALMEAEQARQIEEAQRQQAAAATASRLGLVPVPGAPPTLPPGIPRPNGR